MKSLQRPEILIFLAFNFVTLTGVTKLKTCIVDTWCHLTGRLANTHQAAHTPAPLHGYVQAAVVLSCLPGKLYGSANAMDAAVAHYLRILDCEQEVGATLTRALLHTLYPLVYFAITTRRMLCKIEP